MTPGKEEPGQPELDPVRQEVWERPEEAGE